MVSIPLGDVEIQVKRRGTRGAYVEQLQAQLQAIVGEVIGRCIEAALEAEVTELLGRTRYVRRGRVPRRVTEARCKRCGTRATWMFSRNGHYPRQLETSWGLVRFQMPQLKCECGGSVQMGFQTVRRRQRIWDDVAAEIREHYGWGESLRAIKAGLDRRLGSSLSLRTINARVHAVAGLVTVWQQTPQSACPPVVRVDGLWVPQMVHTGRQRADSLGRMRAVKRGVRRPLLVAQGVWPERDQQAVVAWVLGEGEGTADWTRLLNQMWEREICPQRGLRLLVADGSSGLPRARALVYWNVPFQRCVFHKLRNIWKALVVPEDLEQLQARAYKRRLIRQAARVWQAARVDTARERHATWCYHWEAEQPDAVATMRRDFEQTLTFYAVQASAKQQGAVWPATYLRTTSHLERLFRVVRRRVRQALVLHSPTGLLALAHQSFTRWAAGQSGSAQDRADWPLHLERALATTAPIS